MLRSCPVQGESLGGQCRTAAFAQTVSKAVAVATGAVASAPEAPPSIRPVLASARTVAQTGYRATQVTGGSPLRLLIAGLVAAIVGGVLATQGMVVVGVTGTIIALAGLYLIAWGAWGLDPRLLRAVAAITALALLASLTLAWVRTFLWGNGAKSAGWAAAHVLPWLRSSWWGGLVLIGGFLALAVITGAILHRRPSRGLGGMRQDPGGGVQQRKGR